MTRVLYLSFGATFVLGLVLISRGVSPPSALATPANDNFANAIAITTPAVSGIVAVGSSVGATDEGPEPHTCSGANTVWYNWTSPAGTGTVIFDTYGSSFDTILAIYTGSALNALTDAGCNDDFGDVAVPSGKALTYAAGTTYRIQVGGHLGATGGVVLNMSLGADMVVNSIGDTTANNASLTLREAMLLAVGGTAGLGHSPLNEAAQILNSSAAGASGSDLIHFVPSLGTISISSSLFLSANNDVVSGIGGGVEIASGIPLDCFILSGNSNHIEGLQVTGCGGSGAAVTVTGSDNVIGGSLTPGQRNVLNTNGYGVGLYGGNGNKVIGNFIGTDAAGTSALANSVDGVRVFNSSGNTIGGSAAGEGNVISGNAFNGVELDFGASFNIVRGNRIGVGAGGGALGNGGVGILMWGSSNNNFVGGTGAGEANIIAFNGSDGVGAANFVYRNTIRGNSIHSNVGAGISLSGGNEGIAAPIIGSATATTVTGTACTGCAVDVYNDQAFQGRVYLGSATANGSGLFSLTVGAHTLANATATATDANGNTSEFGVYFGWLANSDGDGLPDASDACPLVAEDVDGYQDGDGCPDPDNDLDGICDPGLTSVSCTGSDFGRYLWKNPLPAQQDCRNVAEDYDSFHDTDGCPEPDNDYDNFPDGTDDCPGTDTTAGADGVADTGDEPILYLTPVQTREDFDGVIDTDGCHDSPEDDYDGDSRGILQGGLLLFRDEREALVLGTDPVHACAATPTANDEPSPDAWPPDFNDNQSVSITDVLFFKGQLDTTNGRFDFDGSGSVAVTDVLYMKFYFNQTCTA